MDEVDGVNAKIAVLITRVVGSMWCAYVFAIIAFLGLKMALGHGGVGPITDAWVLHNAVLAAERLLGRHDRPDAMRLVEEMALRS